MVFVSLRFVVVGALVGTVCARGQSRLDDARSTLDKWVETRQLISRTKSDWQSDKEMLEQSVQLYSRELKTLEEQMTKLGTNNAQVEKERLEATASLKSSNETLERAGELAAGFEVEIRSLVPRLPAPLREILKPLLARMPADASTTKMRATERLQVVVGVLNELDKFNNAVTIFSEKRKTSDGQEVAVESVYVGLGAAYFVNESGNFAGMGRPGEKGWEWSVKPELSARVREVIRIYRNEHPARFISLPVAIQ